MEVPVLLGIGDLLSEKNRSRGVRVPPFAGHMVMRPCGRGLGGSERTGFPIGLG